MDTPPTFICLDDNHVLWQYINCGAKDVGIHGCHDRRRCQNSARDAIARYGINRVSGRNEVNNMVHDTRKIDGKIYHRETGLGTGHATKANAQKLAKKLRNKGLSARVVKIKYKGKTEYHVFSR